MTTQHENTGASRRIGYACSYMPEEIITAAGLVPWRIVPESPPARADAHMYGNTCFYIKSLLAAALEGGAAHADGFVVINSCDGMRKLYDIWQEYVPGVPAFYLDLPKRQEPDAIAFFATELRRLIAALEAAFPGAIVTSARLEDAIRAHNRIRRRMGEVLRLQRETPPQVQGTEFLDLTHVITDGTPQDVQDGLGRFLAQADAGHGHQRGPRVVVSGNVLNRPDVLQLIENAGAQVVAVDTCFGVRHYDLPVAEGSPDPVHALAERYLHRSPCPRMEGNARRFQCLSDLAEACEADAVLYTAVKFCDSHLYDVPVLAEQFKRAGMPFLSIENDYEWTGLGQIQTRVEAFLEMVAQGGE